MEYRIFGPPGTGKTTALTTRYIPDAVDKFGSDRVMVTSFTRAAAVEIAYKKSKKTGKVIDVLEDNVGTLHSICYNALGCPTIIETKKDLISNWNERHPGWAITGGATEGSVDTMGTESGGSGISTDHGDRIFNTIKIRRNKMTPQKFWQAEQIAFHKAWEEYKKETESVDFTDLIELSLKKLPRAPRDPAVIFVDEAQDFTKLQLALVRSWGVMMDHVVLSGDDDQVLFSWAGASPEAMLLPDIPSDQKRILKQSYRVPQSVMDRSKMIISRVSYREPKEYFARIDRLTNNPASGIVREHGSNWRQPEAIVDEIAEIVKQNKSCMIIASCGYMLKPFQSILMSNGIPFGNRYRRNGPQGRLWNPLYRDKSEKQIGSVDLIYAFASNGIDVPYWNVSQFVTWAQFISVGDNGLKRKIGKKAIEYLKKAVENNEAGLHTTREVLGQVLTESAIERALSRDMQWFTEHLQSKRINATLEYAVKVYKNGGIDSIEDEPSITVGTIHSVKGGESDVVFLMPDISWEADANMQASYNVEGRDSIYRMFYVGMTRAKEELILCAPANRSINKMMTPRLYIEL